MRQGTAGDEIMSDRVRRAQGRIILRPYDGEGVGVAASGSGVGVAGEAVRSSVGAGDGVSRHTACAVAWVLAMTGSTKSCCDAAYCSAAAQSSPAAASWAA